MKLFFILCLLSSFIFGATLDFDLFKKETQGENTLLVIGGIHGDEPGGYFAPAILVQNYTISKGNLWVVPNLNFDSLIRNSRGIYGDMNRKFNTIKKDDPDYKSVIKIKEIMTDKQVDLILNLHDGRGFYRHTWESSIFNPAAWGQSFIIDQTELNGARKFQNLDEIAKKVSENLNEDLIENHHTFNIKNTKTQEKDEQMQLSLTYFAITNNKPAFAVETSKNITDLVQKVKYQLKAIESFMDIMEIEYQRDFDLNNLQELTKVVNSFQEVSINDTIRLNLDTIKPINYYFPLKKKENKFQFDHPLGAVIASKNSYQLMIGNKRVATLMPQYFEYCEPKKSVEFIVDGISKSVQLGETIEVEKDFKVKASNDLRVNIIGFSQKNIEDENNILLSKKDILKRFSIDQEQNSFRVEFYDQQNQFCGMIIVKFK